MGKMSREKGKRGERELAAKFREFGYSESHRGQQYNGADGSADVVGLPGIHSECKRVEKLDLHEAMAQAVEGSGADGLPYGYDLPAVFHRKNRCEWLVTMRVKEWMWIYQMSAKSCNIDVNYVCSKGNNVYDWLSGISYKQGFDKLFFGEDKEAVPVLFHRKPEDDWLITMQLDDWIIMYREYEAAM